MKIVVIGGSGLVGSKVVTKLGEHGHEAVSATPKTGVNTITGEGLAEVLDGAAVVIDVSNSPSFEDQDVLDFFTTSTSNVLAAENAAGVGHHLAISIVGAERIPASGYLRAKVVQEDLVKGSGAPYSIVHATQFFEFVDGIADAATVGNEVHLTPAFFQPVAADDVASLIDQVATGTPLNGTREIGGPQKVRMADFIRTALAQRNDPRIVVSDPHAEYFGAELSGDELVPGEGATLGTTTFEDWTATRADLA